MEKKVYVVVGTFPDEPVELYAASICKEKAVDSARDYIEHWCPWLENASDIFLDGEMAWTDDREGDVLSVVIEEMQLS